MRAVLRAESELSRKRLLDDLYCELPNSLPIANARGFAASFSTAGSVDLSNAFFTPQGTNAGTRRRCCARPVHYERELGFIYTAEQGADLVAFLEAL